MSPDPGVWPCMTALKACSLDAGWFRQRYARHDSHCPVARAASSAGFTELAKSPAGVCMGSAVSRLHGSHACIVRDLFGHRRAGARHAFQPRLGAGGYGFGLGGTGANHPDLDTGFRRHGGAGGDRRDGQRDPAVSDGGFRSADDTDATDKTPSSDAGDAFHRGHPVGRMLSAAATGAARAPDRFHAWSRHRSCFRLPRCQCDWLQPRSQSAANCLPPQSCC